jgi:hypothetical protein
VSALSAFETAEFDELAVCAADAEAMSAAGQRPRLQLVAGSRQPALAAPEPGPNVWPAGHPRMAAPSPVRLTRRGRLVLGALVVVVATVAITLVSMAVSGAQASSHGRAGAGYQGMHQIVVRPGESLWSIAERAEPAADPRLVVAQIMTANSMTSSALQAGELLWVPK